MLTCIQACLWETVYSGDTNYFQIKLQQNNINSRNYCFDEEDYRIKLSEWKMVKIRIARAPTLSF